MAKLTKRFIFFFTKELLCLVNTNISQTNFVGKVIKLCYFSQMIHIVVSLTIHNLDIWVFCVFPLKVNMMCGHWLNRSVLVSGACWPLDDLSRNSLPPFKKLMCGKWAFRLSLLFFSFLALNIY